MRSYSIFGYASDEGSKQSYNMARIRKCLGFYAYSLHIFKHKVLTVVRISLRCYETDTQELSI